MTIPSDARLGRYEIRSKIGEGGMGEVYLAQDTKLDRKVALKILPTELAANQDRMRRFVQEAKAAAALNHPNIAHIYEIGETAGVNFIAMEFIDGQTLREVIHRGQTDLSKLLRCLQHTAEGLAKAHAARIVHRDLKPDNIMVTRDGHAKILDFGLAKLIERSKPGGVSAEEMSAMPTAVMAQHSLPGTVLGTVGYMSPEQAQGKTTEIDQRSDIFSFGCILFEALTRRRAFEGKDVLDSLHKIVHAPTPQLRDFNADAPDELQKIVRRCLAKDPDDRYHSIKDVAIELKELRRELEVSGMDITVPPSIDVASAERTSPAATGQAIGSAISIPPASSSTRVSTAKYILTGLKQPKLAAVVVFIVLGIAAASLSLYLHARRTEDTIKSIAVLPFVNETGNADMEYLSDGMTESLISRLSQLPKLNVKARNSVFRFKGKDVAPKDIAKQLNVQAIVTGRIVQHGQDLTLYIELVDGFTENTLWKNDYQRQVTNLIALQSEIARDVARKLELKLASSDEQKLIKTYTRNSEAYELLLRARYVSHAFTPDAWHKAIDYSNQALEKEPNYAPAFAMLAEAYFELAYNDVLSSDTLPKAKDAAKRALEIDDTLADTHAALGEIKMAYDWDQAGAEREFKRAVELSPGEAAWHNRYGWYLGLMGRFDEGMTELKQAQALDPLNEVNNTAIAANSFWAGHNDLATEQMQKVIEQNPNYGIAHQFLSQIYTSTARFPDALAELRKAGELGFTGTAIQLSELGYVYGLSGKRAEAQKQLDQLKELSRARYVSQFHFAVVYIGLGDTERALQSLEQAYQERSVWLVFLKVDYKFDTLRSDSRFVDLMRRVGLTP